MDNQRILYVVNFGRKLSEEIIKDIEFQYKAAVIEHLVKTNLNLSKNIYIQIIDVINTIPKELFDSNKKICINFPGLPIASAYILVELHAKLGFFPLALELYRTREDDPIFNGWKLKKITDLEYERNRSRSKMFDPEDMNEV
jgi:hypothetical protein